MTLIVTAITEMGLLQASDSNLTDLHNRTSTGKKVFQLGFCSGALALAGSYIVGTTDMDKWMPDAIEVYRLKKAPTLGGFAHYLGDRLTHESHDGDGLLIHIAGYASDGAESHPEMWFVRNYKGIDEATGNYCDRGREFQVSEDFWARDYRAAREAGRRTGTPFQQWYFNGTPAEGRVSYHVLHRHLRHFLDRVWNHPDWSFRSPRTIDELAVFLRLELDVISALFNVSDYVAPYVGGPAQVDAIAPPPGSVAL